jgi:hypothetical protein
LVVGAFQVNRIGAAWEVREIEDKRAIIKYFMQYVIANNG